LLAESLVFLLVAELVVTWASMALMLAAVKAGWSACKKADESAARTEFDSVGLMDELWAALMVGDLVGDWVVC